MKRSERNEWCAALRSGKYKQTTGVLKRGEPDDPSYCCLGVKAELDGNICRTDTGDWRHKGGYDATLPREELPLDTQKTLYKANDTLGYSFAEIADLIEKIVPVED